MGACKGDCRDNLGTRTFLRKTIAEGFINETFTNENLQSTYGGKLELAHAEELSVSIKPTIR